MLLIDGLLQRQCARSVALLGRRDGGPWTQYSSCETPPPQVGRGRRTGPTVEENGGEPTPVPTNGPQFGQRERLTTVAMLGSGFDVTATLGCLSRFHPVREGRRLFASSAPGRFDRLATLGYGVAAAPGIPPQRPSDILDFWSDDRVVAAHEGCRTKRTEGSWAYFRHCKERVWSSRFIVMPQVSWQTMMKQFPGRPMWSPACFPAKMQPSA